MNNLDLKAKPFNLNEKEIQWVENTLASMSLDEKIGQLFCPIGGAPEPADMQAILDIMHPGGLLFRPNKASVLQEAHRYLQENSKIPLLLAANLEAGGNGTAQEGTFFGYPMEMAAAGDTVHAYHLGKVAASEGSAVGCNWAFAPILDINRNPLSPITNVRTYGDDPAQIIRMARAFIKGVRECDMAVSIKHFPGDGMDSRDQHLHPTENYLTPDEWDASYGRIYRAMIEDGAETVMVGHIMLPGYSRELVPGIQNEDIRPATTAPELLQGLLREKLGFNGVIVTDASPMGGFTMAMSRREAIPTAIAAGCDMFLFNRNMKEDFQFMKEGLENGILTEQRLDEAVTRILALKASMKLPQKQQHNELVESEAALSRIGQPEYQQWAATAADEAVTLVKDTQQVLPLDPLKQPRILLYIFGDRGGYFGDGAAPVFKEMLEKAGFQVDVFDKDAMRFAYIDISVEEITQEYDAAIYFANIEPASNKTTLRVEWNMPMASDMPWFLHDLPTIGISVASPYLLEDMPMLKTLVNVYSGNRYVLQAIVDKITGQSEFKGQSPVDPFCGQWQARL